MQAMFAGGMDSGVRVSIMHTAKVQFQNMSFADITQAIRLQCNAQSASVPTVDNAMCNEPCMNGAVCNEPCMNGIALRYFAHAVEMCANVSEINDIVCANTENDTVRARCK